jgi:hypothetical protein
MVSNLTDEISGNFTYCHKWVSLLDKDGVGTVRDKKVARSLACSLLKPFPGEEKCANGTGCRTSKTLEYVQEKAARVHEMCAQPPNEGA